MNLVCFFCTSPECEICAENRECPKEEDEPVVYHDGWYEVQSEKR